MISSGKYVIDYDSHCCGVVKKQIKFNFISKSQVDEFEKNIKRKICEYENFESNR